MRLSTNDPKTYIIFSYENMITEICAGMVLHVSDKEDKAWNDSAQRSIDIIKKYKNGKGLFQQCEKEK